MTDHLLRWCEIRDQIPWHQTRRTPDTPHRPPTAQRDGIAHHITTAVHARDPQRAERLLSAYRQAHADAAARRPLDFERLARWQQNVLGTTRTPFRSGTAYAKAGRERYGLHPDTPARFEACLAQTPEPALPVAARAARVYLDVCFFHPFDDGNARSALLALAHTLAADDIVLDHTGPLFHLQRPADDPAGARALADLIAALVEHTQQRHQQTTRLRSAGPA